MAAKTVLVVDDDPKAVELVRLYLDRDGYRVLTAYDGTEALRLARETHPDLVILDLMLPGINGLEVCHALRNESDVPVIMLTARTSEQDRIYGLDLGADDYVTKPFSRRELAARVRAVLRRLSDDIERGLQEFRCGDLMVSLARHECFLGEKKLNLTPVEFKLLSVMVKEPERVFSREQLVEKALGYEFEGSDRTIDVHILNLRRKVEAEPGKPRWIQAVYGVGYKLIETNDQLQVNVRS